MQAETLLRRPVAARRALASDRATRAPQRPAPPDEVSHRLLWLISHELRSPLSRIQSWAHVLENELGRALGGESGREAPREPGPLLQRALAGLRNGVREQAGLLDQLLHASHALAGALHVERRPLRVMPVLEAALAGVRPAANARRIRFLVTFADAELCIEGDAEALRQACVHLLSNAIRFSPEGAEVRLRLWRERGQACIRVEDRGQGVAPEFLPHLFGWFQRADDARGGLGLELALARELTELQGGQVQGESAGPGQGASFTLRFAECRPFAARSL